MIDQSSQKRQQKTLYKCSALLNKHLSLASLETCCFPPPRSYLGSFKMTHYRNSFMLLNSPQRAEQPYSFRHFCSWLITSILLSKDCQGAARSIQYQDYYSNSSTPLVNAKDFQELGTTFYPLVKFTVLLFSIPALLPMPHTD